MPITIKSGEELELMRHAGFVLASMHEELRKALKPGMSTLDIDKLALEITHSYDGCEPNFLGYEGFPGTVCVSVNDQVVHGIPRADRIIMEGDIVSIDGGVVYKGYHSDAARTWCVGEVSPEKRKLVEVTKQAFFEGMKFAKAGNHLYDISAAIQKYVESFGYGIARELTGHGIGTELHEEPTVPNYKPIGRGLILKKGMTLAVEPIVNMASPRVKWLDDWDVVTADGKPSAHYENTILITDGEPELLSVLRD